MKTVIYALVFCVCNPLFALSSHALTLNSGEREVQLIELYTSEGCSSCPAADRWMSAQRNSDELWKSFVPVAFHVDYWDYLGWKDKFAEKAFSDRQRLHQRQGNVSNVYTPSFVIQGKEWRGWFQGEKRPPQRNRIAGNLRLGLEKQIASINYNPKTQIDTVIVNVVVLGFGLKHSILRGENAGSELHHDFIVLQHQKKASRVRDNLLSAEFVLPELDNFDYTKLAVAAWITSGEQIKPLQAVGGWYEIASLKP